MSEFFAMGGYGFYVWCSMGAVAVLMILEPVLLSIKHRQLIKNIKRQNRRQASRENTASQTEKS
ncbi:heme exporter protein CcmD [Leucothrix arctica]|uniref:Heme exporter protein D n=1 Tax=Leucothrix arctica TaxID=1481894 RepID=A0A317C8J9_9GAMM|nr:heme exporter protein CcmD [Leucothrix arctica]PWQ94995.1 heme exporter protein CcmD [Leucothrix arctica]